MSTKHSTIPALPHFDFEVSTTLASAIFASTERLAALNLSATRSLVEQSARNLQALLNVKDLNTLSSLQAAQVQPTIEHALAYSRGLFAIASETKDEIAKIVEEQFAETNAKVSTLVVQALKNAPAGSEVAVATIRKTMDAAHTTFTQISQAAKHVSEIAEANVTAASEATIKAVGSASKKLS